MIPTCEDIDECLEDNGGCDQGCRNTEGGHTCSCDQGYTLNEDDFTCRKTDEFNIALAEPAYRPKPEYRQQSIIKKNK